MTAYAASALFKPGTAYSGPCVCLKANTYPIRIARVETSSSAGPLFFIMYHQASIGGISGTTFTPVALRGGAPATTATAWSNITAGPTGTQSFITIESVASVSLSGTTTISIPGSSSYNFPFDYIIKPGDGFLCLANAGFTSSPASPYTPASIGVYYEELRLSWSF